MSELQSEFYLSIIIPVYGVEDYIEALLVSLIPQINDQVECIFVDDGCKDQSIAILKKYLHTHNVKQQIRILVQENQGLSMARNNGIQIAQGQYITFLDSDDYVEPYYIERLLTVIHQNPTVDLIQFNAWCEDKKYEKKRLALVEKNGLVKADQQYLNNIFSRNKWYAWLRVYNRDLLKNFSFPKGLLFEDMLSIPALYNENILIYDICEPLLYYRYRSSSITNSTLSPHHLESLEYGVNLYRGMRNISHFRMVYIYLILTLFSSYLTLNFKLYSKFIDRIKSDDLLFLSQIKLRDIHWKKRLMLKIPKAFYWYKNRLGFKRYKK